MSANYLMEDPREAARLARKVDAAGWFAKYLAPLASGPRRVLDVGCGPGVLAMAAASGWSGCEIVGVDLSRSRLDEACRRNGKRSRVSFIRSDACSLPFTEHTFDLVYCRFLLEYLSNRANAVSEMVRVCRPGGIVLLQDLDGQLLWHYPIDPELESGLEKVVAGLSQTGFDPFVGRKLYALARQSGLEDIQVQVEPYHLYAGRIDQENDLHWQEKLAIALPAVGAIFDDEVKARALCGQLMDHLRNENTLTYSVVFTVHGRKRAS